MKTWLRRNRLFLSLALGLLALVVPFLAKSKVDVDPPEDPVRVTIIDEAAPVAAGTPALPTDLITVRICWGVTRELYPGELVVEDPSGVQFTVNALGRARVPRCGEIIVLDRGTGRELYRQPIAVYQKSVDILLPRI